MLENDAMSNEDKYILSLSILYISRCVLILENPFLLEYLRSSDYLTYLRRVPASIVRKNNKNLSSIFWYDVISK